MTKYISVFSLFLYFATTAVMSQPKRLAYYDAIALDSLAGLAQKDTSQLKFFFLDILQQYASLKDTVKSDNPDTDKVNKAIDDVILKFQDNLFITKNELRKTGNDYKNYIRNKEAAKKELLQIPASKLSDFIRKFRSYILGYQNKYSEASINNFVGDMGTPTPPGVTSTVATSAVSGALPWQATAIAGTAEFLAERFQDEVSQYFLDRLRDTLQNSPQFQYLFPSTYALISVDRSAWAYGTMFQLLKTSMQSDIERMPDNLNQFVQNVQPFKARMDSSIQLQLLSDLLTIYGDLQSGLHPADILDQVSDLQVVKKSKDTALVASIRIASTILGAMREKKDSSNAWVSLTKVNAMSGARKNYLAGLLFQSVKDDTIGKYNGQPYTLGLASSFIDNAKKEELRKYFQGFEEQFIAIGQAIEKAKEKYSNAQTKGEDAGKLYLSYVDVSLQIFERSMDHKIFSFIENDSKRQTRLANYKMIIFHTRQLIQTYQQQNYGATISNALVILQECDTSWSGSSPNFFRYASFMASLAGAKNSGDVKDAISAAALPVGSYSLKRKADLDLSLNSYVGVGGGADWVAHQSTSGLAGIAAPIGVTFTWGNSTGGVLGIKCLQAGSVHLNLFDFGIPLNYAFRDTSGFPTNIQFKDLLALGIGGLVHFRDAPISMGILVMYTPDLRDIEGIPYKQSSVRALLTVGVDIPIFDIFSKSE